MGSSMAENHPVGFRWVIKARERGATIIHVDQRFSRTSAMADLWVPLRAGSDIVFLGALVNYVLTNDLAFRDYIVPFTNAATIISEDFRDTEDLDGLFSGWTRRTSSTAPSRGRTKDRNPKPPASRRSTIAAGTPRSAAVRRWKCRRPRRA